MGLAAAQEQKKENTTPNMDMSAHAKSDITASDMHDMPAMGNDGSALAMHSMEHRPMDMSPHMKMTTLRDLKPGDQEKADQVLEAARSSAEKYKDYRAALADGYKIFLPNLPQKQYHFTNYWYGFEAGMRFNPDHPTSLLYETTGDDYKLIGVMYTAPKNVNWSELDKRIPLRIAQWHAHVNMCVPAKEKRQEAWGVKPKFGLAGLERTVKPLAENSFHRFSAGWYTSTRLSRSRKTSGRSSAKWQGTWINPQRSCQSGSDSACETQSNHLP